MYFKDKVVIVTGASSGIGAATAIKFAGEGAKVVIVGRNQNKLQYVASQCRENLLVIADVTKEEDCQRLVNQTITNFGRLDVLVNNAGIGRNAAITAENAMQVFDQMMSTNLRAPVYITHLAAPHLIKTKGNIVNISSVVALRIFSAGSFAYSASKAALDHFTRSIALDLAPSQVRVNGVNPGPVRTDFFENQVSPAEEDAIWDSWRKATPLERISEPEEIADLILFLASDKAKAITGSCYVTDNGLLLNNKL